MQKTNLNPENREKHDPACSSFQSQPTHLARDAPSRGGVHLEKGWGEACDFCQCSHMSNTPMHDVHMLKVLVWTQ